MAAAIVGRCDVIVTRNAKDFPAASLALFRTEAHQPDLFIRHAIALEEATCLDAVGRFHGELVNPPMDAPAHLDTRARQELPGPVA